jgi:hypothetical protein
VEVISTPVVVVVVEYLGRSPARSLSCGQLTAL